MSRAGGAADRPVMRWSTQGVKHSFVLCALSIAAASCAASSGVIRPAAFPTAPAPPSSIYPSPLGPAKAAPDVPSIVAAALDLRGVPYQLGGDDPDIGFDCSGFVRFVYSQQHVTLPRTVAEQVRLGSGVPLARVRAGDLVFFSTTAPGASHVGIVIGPAGNDEFVHAPANSGTVRVEHFNSAYWRQRFVAARRLF